MTEDIIALMLRIETLYPITFETIQRSLAHLKASNCAWSDEDIIEALGRLAYHGCTGIDASIRIARIAEIHEYSAVKNGLHVSLETLGVDERSAPPLVWYICGR
ncbi:MULTISPECIES: hypothetical protein [Bacillus]|uniref:hypothetical protein n=1 Tax=Bacillus TaxID=1386 RepID=UPI000676A2BE|nr:MULTISPECIES: hypothetical protein [Bacillus]AMK73943.1 hypothetical protein AWV81_18310 [Bacillus subtilis subsp. natto]API43654.1 hypothetical protein BSR08_14660 [Bacillus subtilis]API97236.1 hypothetical protein BKP58_16025 [Bacillus subtilis]ARI86068.1 hypothetical protein B7470_07930 [Bacillus subtilis]AVL04436.1 hypothetical protein BS21228_08500 [Bacillus subtilis]